MPINSDKADRFSSERTITVTSSDTSDPYINTATLSSDFNGNSENTIELTVNRANKVTNSLTINMYNPHGDTVRTQTYNGSTATTIDITPENLMPLTTINRSVYWADDSADDGWVDVNIKGDALPFNGSYVVQVYVNDGADGDTLQHYSEYYTGFMSWYKDATANDDTDEIVLHKAGKSSNGNNLFLRTRRNNGSTMSLEIACWVTNDNGELIIPSHNSNIVFKFRHLI